MGSRFRSNMVTVVLYLLLFFPTLSTFLPALLLQ
jgi:hypothetical protein